MVHAASPTHFADVHQAFNTFFKANERAVAHQADNGSLQAGIDRILLLDLLPWAGFLLLHTKGNLFALAVDVENLDFNLVANLDDFGWMIHATPTHVGDVQQTIKTTKINERAEVGDVGHGAAHNVAFVHLVHQLALGIFALVLDQLATADDDIASLKINLENHGTHCFADEFANIAGTANINLAGWKEHWHANVHQKSALDFAQHFAFNNVAFLAADKHLLPTANAVGLALGKHNASVWRFSFFNKDFNFITDGDAA